MDDKKAEISLKDNTEKLGKAINIAVNISKLIQNRFVVSKLNWLSVLFIRLCNTSMTIYRLIPNNKLTETYYENWDSSSIMALSRNFCESYHLFFYLGIEDVPEEEWLCRKKILNLHDCVERRKIFGSFDINGNNFLEIEESLKSELKKNHYFITLKPEQQKEYLKGKKALLVDRTEIENKIGNNTKDHQWIYKFFSQHIHSFPISFYKISSKEGRGRGIENDVDKTYIAMAADYVSSYLIQAIADTIEIFGDVKAKLAKKDIDWLISLKYVNNEAKKPVDTKELTLDVRYKRDTEDKLERIRLTVIKDISQNTPKHISVNIPNNITLINGVFIKFCNIKDIIDTKRKSEFDKEKAIRIPFEKFDDKTCTVHIKDRLTDDDGNIIQGVFQKILDFDKVWFLLTYPDGSHKSVIVPLISLKKYFK